MGLCVMGDPMGEPIVGNYRITARLSEGGMGAIYRAEHVLLGKPAAVKMLLPELSHDRDLVARFFNEAKIATSIRHPGIVEIYDFGRIGCPISGRSCRCSMQPSESW